MLDCANVAIKHYSLNPARWGMVKNTCEGLLNKKEHEWYVFHYKKDGDDDCQDAWARLLKEFNPQDQDIHSSNYEGEYQCCTEAEEWAADARDKCIALHQLRAYSKYLQDNNNPAEVEAYRRFLVSVLTFACSIDTAIISRFRSVGALQPQGCCEQGAWASFEVYSGREVQVCRIGGSRCGRGL